MSGPVTLHGPAFVPVLARVDFSASKPQIKFLGVALLTKPLLAAAVGLGNGFIASTVEKQESTDPAPLPLARRVVLLLEPTLQLVAETVSDAVTGAYRFDGLNPNARFTVISFDHAHKFRAVLADNLAPSV